MRLESVWTTLIYVIDILTFSSSGDRELAQKTFTGPSASNIIPITHTTNEFPHFPAPKNPQSGEQFTCTYPQMTGFKNCHSPENRSCWVQSPDTTFDIDSDSETNEGTPTGIVRKVRRTHLRVPVLVPKKIDAHNHFSIIWTSLIWNSPPMVP
jgi:hypothetical protein